MIIIWLLLSDTERAASTVFVREMKDDSCPGGLGLAAQRCGHATQNGNLTFMSCLFLE